MSVGASELAEKLVIYAGRQAEISISAACLTRERVL